MFIKAACLVSAMLLSWVTPVSARQLQETGLRSLVSSSKAEITFVNTSKQVAEVFWVDFQGHNELYKVLQPGESLSQQTYLSHPWVITDSTGSLWGVFYADSLPRNVHIFAPVARKS